MDKTRMRELLDFASDEQRFDKALSKVIAGVESGAISPNEFPALAGPLKPGTLPVQAQEHLAEMLIQLADVELSPEQRLALKDHIRGLDSNGTLTDLTRALADDPSLSEMGGALAAHSPVTVLGVFGDTKAPEPGA